jgi:hypothetical protein
MPTQAELMSAWERGAGERIPRRTLTLLRVALPAASDEELLDLPVGTADAALLDLREEIFGAQFSGVTTCPACTEAIELSFDTAEVRRPGSSPALISATRDGHEVKARIPRVADLIAAERAGSIERTRRALFARCTDGVRADALPDSMVDEIAACMAASDPQADVTLDVICPVCAHAWLEPFDAAAFLWHELSAWVRHLITEVHLLASAYGWSEGEILRLSPARRHAYLELVR